MAPSRVAAQAQAKRRSPSGRSRRSARSAPVPQGVPLTPIAVGQGLAVWLAYQGLRKAKGPFRWGFTQSRQALRGWTDYNKYLREQAVVEGVFNGRKVWLGVGAVVWGARALRKATGGAERIVLNEILQPGDQILISQIPKKLPRKVRRAAKNR